MFVNSFQAIVLTFSFWFSEFGLDLSSALIVFRGILWWHFACDSLSSKSVWYRQECKLQRIPSFALLTHHNTYINLRYSQSSHKSDDCGLEAFMNSMAQARDTSNKYGIEGVKWSGMGN